MVTKIKKKAVKKKTGKKKGPGKGVFAKSASAILKEHLSTEHAINTPENYVFGRPSEYNRDYPRMVYEACKSGECLTIASICCLLDIDRDTYHNWCKSYPDFFHAIKKGTELRKNHMEKKGLNGMNRGKDFGAAPFIFLMKNIFPDEYKDKQEIKQEIENKNINLNLAFNTEEPPDELDERGGDSVESNEQDN